MIEEGLHVHVGRTRSEPQVERGPVRRPGDVIRTVRSSTGAWSLPQRLFAVPDAVEAIAAVTWPPLEQHVVVSSAGSLLHAWDSGVSRPWTAPTDVQEQAGEVGPVVDVAAAGTPGSLHVCAVTSDGRAWHALRLADGSWSPMQDIEAVAGEAGTVAGISACYVQTVTHAGLVVALITGSRVRLTARHSDGTWAPLFSESVTPLDVGTHFQLTTGLGAPMLLVQRGDPMFPIVYALYVIVPFVSTFPLPLAVGPPGIDAVVDTAYTFSVDNYFYVAAVTEEALWSTRKAWTGFGSDPAPALAVTWSSPVTMPRDESPLEYQWLNTCVAVSGSVQSVPV